MHMMQYPLNGHSYQEGDENLVSETHTIKQPLRNLSGGFDAIVNSGCNNSRQEAVAIHMFGIGSHTSLQQSLQKNGEGFMDPCSSELLSEQYDGLSQTAKKLKQASLRGIQPKMGHFGRNLEEERT